jgi:hypothetical protein
MQRHRHPNRGSFGLGLHFRPVRAVSAEVLISQLAIWLLVNAFKSLLTDKIKTEFERAATGKMDGRVAAMDHVLSFCMSG